MTVDSIDQLDKAESPPIPESYIYLLAVQCLVSLCEGFASCVAPLYTSIMVQKPRAAGEPIIRAPPSFDLSALPSDDPTTKQLRTVHDMIESGWPAFLAALTFIISTNLSDELFVDVLTAFQALTTVSGMLALNTPRDAFFSSLSKLAIPTRVVSSLDSYTHGEPATPRTATGTLSENLGLSAPSTQPPSLSERNMACLKVFVSSALFLAGSLGDSWFDILEALQNADYVLTTKGARSGSTKRGPGSRTPSGAGPDSAQKGAGSAGTPSSPQVRHPLLSDLDAENMQGAIQRLFDGSKNLDDEAFHHFISALCKLSATMIGMQSEESVVEVESTDDLPTPTGNPLLSPNESAHRRRVSGIHFSRTLVSVFMKFTVNAS